MTRKDLVHLLMANFEEDEEVLFLTETEELCYVEDVEFSIKEDTMVVALSSYEIVEGLDD